MTLRRCCALVALLFVAGVRTVEAQCTATVTPTSVSVPSNGSTSAVSVITGTNCSWTAISNVGWITVTSGATGSGLGQVNYTVAANSTGAVRTGTLTVAGQTVTFTQAINSCAYTVTPTSFTVPQNGNIFTLSVTTGTSCSWTATTTTSWITITAGASGSGIGSVSFTVPSTTAQRTGTLTVAGRTVTVTQDGPVSTAPAPPTNLRIVR
jgi:hypothetical protein